ncbi:hypothetical protein WR25_25219 [Diploscapter pachys]|uniref:Uncharacterized protein n=1 Tax=Diploscapter pachys TaxID=2018661 RepID=A0A2A2KF02_9BILA|nr:hypothetical protein WR25_25219 [Diploscapter pachys]
MTSDNGDIDLYTLMNMPFYTEFCNIMYVAGDDKLPDDNSVVFVMSETRRRMHLLIERLYKLADDLKLEQAGRNQTRRFPAAERCQFDRENEQIHAGELAIAFITKPRTLLDFESAADPHIQPRNLMECIDEEKRKVTVDWQLCHKLMRHAMHIVDPFEEFEEFDDAPNRQRQAKCFNRFKSTAPSEYIQFTETKKQATFLKKDISGKSCRETFWKFLAMNEKENEKRMEENVFYVLTYIMKEYVTRIVENAATLQKMTETQSREEPRAKIRLKFYESAVQRESGWKK